NGQSLPITLLHSDQGTRFFQTVIPGRILDADRPFADCEFRVNRVTSLNEVNPLDPDTRPVGLAFNFVQIFPLEWERQSSALLPFFECEQWKTTVEFLQKYGEPEDTVAAPLIFKVKLENPVIDHQTFLDRKTADWVVIHKGRTDRMGTVLTQLALGSFSPVFANDVFVVYSQKPLPKLSYLSPHVKPVYVDRVKQALEQNLKPVYRKIKHKVSK
ncbi:MAG TPA: hypothetical protein V6C65_03030, partial [Allocoleopsis sp.]